MAQLVTNSPGVKEDRFKVFISYSRSDAVFADQLVAALEASNFEITLDRADISGGDDWKERLSGMLLDSDAVVFVLSPTSVASPQCAWEVGEAKRLSKKIMPIVCQSLGEPHVPEALAKLNHIYFYPEARFPGSGFGAGLKRLGTDLKTDQGWVREQKRLLSFAMTWESRNKEPALLNLRGSQLTAAERWLAQVPAALDAGALTRKFINNCRQAEEAGKRKDLHNARRLTWIALAAVIGVSGFAVALFLEKGKAEEAQVRAEVAQSKAEAAQTRAEAARDDAAAEARLARKTVSTNYDDLNSAYNDELDWMPPSWAGSVYADRASSREGANDFAKERLDLDRALAFEPNLQGTLTTSANSYVNLGNADAALAHATRAVKLAPANAVVAGNLILAQAMRRDYAAAIESIDRTLEATQHKLSSTDSFVAPDIRSITRGFKLDVRDTDFHLGLRYLKAVLYAMAGDDRFESALDASDRADRDCPNSRNAYLGAVNWTWLIARGQALGDLRAGRSNDAAKPSKKQVDIKDYGVFAALGAVWARVAATRPDFHAHATKALTEFRSRHAQDPQPRYQKLAAWVEQLGQPVVACKAKDSEVLAEALDLELEARELDRGSSSEQNAISKAPVIALITRAIELLKHSSKGRREQDVLIDLYLQRGNLRLNVQRHEQDFGGAERDARRVLELDTTVAEARVLLARSLVKDPAQQRLNYETALNLDPANTAALAGLANILEKDEPKSALELLERRQLLVRTWAPQYAQLARLKATLGRYDEAIADIEAAVHRWPAYRPYYDQRYNHEVASKATGGLAELHRASGYRERAAFYARGSSYTDALGAYVDAFQIVAKLPQPDQGADLEAQSLIRDFTEFLQQRFGRSEARQWWETTKANPLASPRERDLAAGEARRLASAFR